MTTKIHEWGNSLAVRLPKHLLRSSSFRKGTEVELKAVANGILISPSKLRGPERRKRKYKLSELLAKCKGPNPYSFISGGKPVGKERI